MKISIDQLPKRIVLSRKGSDSAWGGSPSLIVGNEMISLPIPEHSDKGEACSKHRKYSDLPPHKVIGQYFSYLPNLKSKGQACVHLDPDIRLNLRPKDARGSKLLFGQSGAAEGHLRNQKIGNGDLFLFFGWFREHLQGTERYVPMPYSADQHVFWGWFQVDERHELEGLNRGHKLQELYGHHPHVNRLGDSAKKDSLYIATSKLSFSKSSPGAGVFSYSPSRVLSRRCEFTKNRTEWCLPEFFQETELTYNKKSLGRHHSCGKDKTRIHFNAANIGQEFIFPGDKSKTLQDFPKGVQSRVAAWLEAVFAK